MEANSSVRVGVHLEHAVRQPAGGLAALLTGAPRESFASLLDGEETVQPDSKNLVPFERKQGEREGGTPQDRKNDHAHSARSSDHHGDSKGIERSAEVNTTAVELRSQVLSQVPQADSKPDRQGVRISADPIKKATEFSIESSAIRDRGADDSGTTAPLAQKGEERTPLPASVIPADGATHELGDASKAKMPQFISSSLMPDSGQMNAVAVGTKIEGDANPVSGSDPALRPDTRTAVVESRSGSRFTVDLEVRGMRQDSGAAPPQLANQLDLSSGGSGPKPDRTTADSQDVDTDEGEGGSVGQLELHGGQPRHDTSGQAFKVAQLASPRSVNGAAVELLNAGQSAAAQRRSVPTQGAPNKPMQTTEAPLREAAIQHAADASTSRMLTNAMRGELHVGLHTEAFGRVTIQTNTGSGQFSAQVSLEDSKQSAALAAHLPAVEQRILQQHGMDASVRIVSNPDGGLAGSSTGNGQGSSGANDGTRGERRGVGAFQRSIGPASRSRSREVAPERLTRTALWGRLDVTV